MIQLFRKYRKKMANDNEPIKYMRYAIGEIVLVVIGILIALSINNWNEDRINNYKKNMLLKALKIEFSLNLKQLDSVLYWDNKVLQNTKRLIRLDPKNKNDLKNDSLPHWLQNSSWRWSFDPTNGALNSGISSGDIHLIKNDSLVHLLYGWQYVVADAKENEERCIAHIEESFSIFAQHVRKFDYTGTYHVEMRDSHFLSDYESLLNDPLFEDYLGDRLHNMKDAIHELNLVKEQNEIILQKINLEL